MTSKKVKRNLMLKALFAVVGLVALIVLAVQISRLKTISKTQAQDIQMPIRVTITSPAWGTILTWKDKTIVRAIVDHDYDLTKVVFQVNTNNNKNVCVLTGDELNATEYSCSYTVPYTGMGQGGGGTAGYGISVYAYDAVGNVGVDVLQMWSHK